MAKKHFRKGLIAFATFVIVAFGVGSMFDSDKARVDFVMVWFVVWSIGMLIDALVYVFKGEMK